jgi:hypothetical protein
MEILITLFWYLQTLLPTICFVIFAKVCVIWYSHVTNLNAFLQKYNILLNISDVINMCTLK